MYAHVLVEYIRSLVLFTQLLNLVMFSCGSISTLSVSVQSNLNQSV